MAKWEFVAYETLASEERSSFSMGPFGSKITKENYVAEGVPVVRGVNLARGIFVDDDFVFITEEKADEILPANVAPGDLIFTHRGTIGQVSMLPRNPRFDRYVIGSSQVKTRLCLKKAVPEFYFYWFQSEAGRRSILENASTVGVPGIATPLTSIRNLKVPLPVLAEQEAVVDVLGALDDKIAVNERIAATARSLGMALFVQETQGDGAVDVEVDSVANALTRGVAPKYSNDPDELIVLNQKCIRDGRVNLSPARRTLGEKVKPPKLLHRNDVLVNSTGVGTLGRVARWTSDSEATVDSHVTIVRFDAQQVDPVCAGFAMLRAQPDIEAMGEGSTGQTELRRAQVGGLEIALPSPSRQRELRVKLDSLEYRADQALAESAALATLRDILLPQLMSGRLRVKDAEKIVEDHV
ncbi:restriction endonuclease subunit S [Streptomyces griseus]|uniref:Restriction endonuclease subunit S n=1 Tax=Streptomyces stephensoniae TaxID=3375367 RepID=A0ABU2W7U5_9ACTN|nr:restriction endonuclease subunit S [Streptomyces griseus]MDT0493927.1 restriction endonuclease subunit S [Streptomyces griseus]